MSDADVRFTASGPVVVAHVSGELDMSNASDLASSMAGAATNDLLGLVLDLSEVEYMDSAGIHMIFTLRESLRRARPAAAARRSGRLARSTTRCGWPA